MHHLGVENLVFFIEYSLLICRVDEYIFEISINIDENSVLLLEEIIISRLLILFDMLLINLLDNIKVLSIFYFHLIYP